jgi:hypothetical protein
MKSDRMYMRKILCIFIITLFLSCTESIKSTDTLLAVWKENKDNEISWGFINKEGEFSIAPQFENALPRGGNDFLYVMKNGKWGVINSKGQTVIDFKYDEPVEFVNGLAKVKINGLYGYIDKTDELVIKNQFEDSLDFTDPDYAAAKKNGLWGIINREGDFKVEPSYTDLKNFSEGLAAFKKENGLYGFIDINNSEVIKPQFEDAGYFKNDIAPVKDGLWGYINKNGNFFIKPVFNKAEAGTENCLYPVMMENKWGYINSLGELVINPLYDNAGNFYNDTAFVNKGSLYGYINSSNEVMWDSSESYFYIKNIPDNIKNKVILFLKEKNRELIRIIRARKLTDNSWLIEAVLEGNDSGNYEWLIINL